MELHVRGNDIQITDDIREAASRHAARLDRLVDRVVDAKLELRRQSQRSGGETTIAQVTVHTGRAILRAEERDHDAVRAVDAVMGKMERQVRRYHERRADRHGPRQTDVGRSDADVEELDDEETIVRTKRFPVKPMHPDEALEQMELLGHDFYLFQNVEESAVSLVYRRRDGTFGLLVPEPM